MASRESSVSVAKSAFLDTRGPDAAATLPEKFRAHVLHDDAKGVIYVDRNHILEPEIRTWISRKTRGTAIRTEVIDASELSSLIAASRQAAQSGLQDDDEDRFRRRVREMIYRAAQYGASDVHIQVRQTDTIVQFVVDGESRDADRMTVVEGSRTLRSIYQGLAPTGDAGYLQSQNQNAQIPGDKFPAESGLTSIRVVRGPCYPADAGGEFMTLRLQYNGGHRKKTRTDILPYPEKPAGRYRLGEMGFTEGQLEKLDRMLAVPEGLIIVVGPTGSGKTTTIYELLSEIQRRKPYKRLITVEDPVEIPIETAVQLSVTNARSAESTAAGYQSAVRTMLRMAPRLIFIGELRDEEVAAIALEAAVTGHTVVTTLHVDEGFQWVDRLETMGTGRLKRHAFCDHKRVRGIVTQRILAHVCPKCSVRIDSLTAIPQTHRLAMSALATWGATSNVRMRGAGCDECQQSGVAGRYAIAEVIETDRQLMTDFVERGTDTARANYRARSGADRAMMDRAIDMVLAGIVDPVSVEDNVDVIPKREDLNTQPRLAHGTEVVNILEARAS